MEALKDPDEAVDAEQFFTFLFGSKGGKKALSKHKNEGGADPVSLNGLCSYKGDSIILQKVRLNAEGLAQNARLLTKLQDAFSVITDDNLWDTASHVQLVLPSSRQSDFSPPLDYAYVGRSFVNRTLTRIKRMVESQKVKKIRLGGPPGRGKSYALAAIAGFLTVHFSDVPVVYVLCSLYASDSFDHLRNALLLAFWRDPTRQVEILHSESTGELVKWCKKQSKMLFFIDEANHFDNEKETAASSKELREAARNNLEVAAAGHKAVWCASQRTTYMKTKTALSISNLVIEEPFNNEELLTWLCVKEAANRTTAEIAANPTPTTEELKAMVTANTEKFNAMLAKLLYYTGNIPRLLELYLLPDGGDEFEAAVSDMLECFNLEGLKQCDIDSLEQLLAGAWVPRKLIKLFPSLLYIDPSTNANGSRAQIIRIWCCCPYMEKLMRIELEKHRRNVAQEDYLTKVEQWKNLIKVHIKDNPARMGWLVEGLVIDCLQARQSLDSTSFKHCMSYNEGKEKDMVNACTLTELEEGILFSPLEFNAKAIDSVLVKYIGGKLLVIGIQITISPWKRKEEKDSHGVWLTKMVDSWRPEETIVPTKVRLDKRFIYILSDVVKAEKSLKKGDSKILKFSSVHESLNFVDSINLPEPSQLRQCKGIAAQTGSRCKLKKILDEDDYYCSNHENQKEMEDAAEGEDAHKKSEMIVEKDVVEGGSAKKKKKREGLEVGEVAQEMIVEKDVAEGSAKKKKKKKRKRKSKKMQPVQGAQIGLRRE